MQLFICGMAIMVYMTDVRTTTTVSLQKSTVQRLSERGKFNESYEDVINRLLEQSEKNDVGERT